MRIRSKREGNRRRAAVAAGTAALVAMGLSAAPAAAETLSVDACAEVDVTATVGTVIDLVYGDGCGYGGFTLKGGTPTVEFVSGAGGRLIWHQAVEAAAGGCDQGWSSSWGQWARGGNGGPVCVRDIDWGTGADVDSHLRVTINTRSDWVEALSATDPWVTGCDGPGVNPTPVYPIVGNCPTPA